MYVQTPSGKKVLGSSPTQAFLWFASSPGNRVSSPGGSTRGSKSPLSVGERCGCSPGELSRVDSSSPTSDCDELQQQNRRMQTWARCGVSQAGVIFRDTGVAPVLLSGVKCGCTCFHAAPQQQQQQQQPAGTAPLESQLIKV